MIEFADGIPVDNLLVTDCGETYRVPVDHAYTSIYIAFVVEIYECVYYGITQVRIHGEFGPVPVTRCTEFAELVENDASVFLLPFPCVLEELLTGDILLADALGLEFGYNLALSCNGSMVCSGHPACILAVHPCLTDEHIIEGIIQYMSHVQDSGHVRWRDYDCIRFPLIRFRMKEFVFKPIGIPFVLCEGRIILCWKFHIFLFLLLFTTLLLLERNNVQRY